MYLTEILATLHFPVSQLVFLHQSSSSDANPAVLNYIIYHWQEQNHYSYSVFLILILSDAPKISPSSSCSRTDVTVCFCEADGNPSPELEWHLSGRPVTNSSNTFISEERLSSTGLRSSITLHQSLTNTSTLQCVSNNTRGTASQLFSFASYHSQKSGNIYRHLLIFKI